MAADIINASDLFAGRKCKPNSLAKHPLHGVVRVVHAEGSARIIEVDRHEVDTHPDTTGLPNGVLTDDVLFSETIFVSEVEVPVTELIELDPFKDMVPYEACTISRTLARHEG